MRDDIAETRTFLDAMVPFLKEAELNEAILRRKLGTAFRIAEYSVNSYEVPLNRITQNLTQFIKSQGGINECAAQWLLFSAALIHIRWTEIPGANGPVPFDTASDLSQIRLIT